MTEELSAEDKIDIAKSILITGLVTDGAHHKQFHLALALEYLVGVDEYYHLLKTYQWEEGTPS